MDPTGSRRRFLVAGVTGLVAAACGRSVADTAGPSHRWLPPASVEIWLGGVAPTVEHVVRTDVLPSLRSAYPNLRVTIAGTAPIGFRSGTGRPTVGLQGSSLGLAAGINPAVLGSAGGRQPSLALRGPTSDGDAFNRLIAEHAAGIPSDVVPAGTGNVSTLRHLRLARPVEDRDLLVDLRGDFTAASVAQVTTRSGVVGVPWLANPRRFVWRADVLASSGVNVPRTWEEVVLACNRGPSGRTRTAAGRRLVAVNGLHLEFYEGLRRYGVAPVEFGRAAFAGDEGIAVAQYLADRGQTDTVSRNATGSTVMSDLAAQGVVGAWTTLAGVLRVITATPSRVAELRVGPPTVPGGSGYPADGTSSGTIATHSLWYVARESRVPDHAWELVRALVDPDALVAVAATSGQVPTRRSAAVRGFLRIPIISEFVAPYLDDGIEAPALPIPVEMESVLLNRLNAIARGEVSPRKALLEAARLWDEATAKAGHDEA